MANARPAPASQGSGRRAPPAWWISKSASGSQVMLSSTGNCNTG